MTCILQLRNCCNIWSLIMGLRRLDILIVRGFPQAGSLQMNSFCLHSSSLFVAAPSPLWIPGETALAHSLRAYIDVFPYLSTLLIFPCYLNSSIHSMLEVKGAEAQLSFTTELFMYWSYWSNSCCRKCARSLHTQWMVKMDKPALYQLLWKSREE